MSTSEVVECPKCRTEITFQFLQEHMNICTITKTKKKEIQMNKDIEFLHGRWRNVQNPTASFPPEPKHHEIALWQADIRDIIEYHKNSDKLADKVTNKAKKIAQQSGILSGKWLIYEGNHKNIDELWETVKQNVVNGKLGPCAKLSQGRGRVMCVYNESYLDENDVWRVYQKLVDLGATPSCWKPDILTLLGLYSSNPNSAGNNSISNEGSKLSVPGLKMSWFSRNF